VHIGWLVNWSVVVVCCCSVRQCLWEIVFKKLSSLYYVERCESPTENSKYYFGSELSYRISHRVRLPHGARSASIERITSKHGLIQVCRELSAISIWRCLWFYLRSLLLPNISSIDDSFSEEILSRSVATRPFFNFKVYPRPLLYDSCCLFQIRKPCYRKETARCRSYSFRFKVRRQHSLQV